MVDLVELGRVRGIRDDEVRPSALRTVLEVDGAQLHGRGQEDCAQADACEHRLPQLHLVIQHDHDVAAALHTRTAQEVRDLVRTTPQHVVRVDLLAAVLLDDPQRGVVIALGLRVEPVGGEVEVLELRPGERGACRLRVQTVLQEQVARRTELLRDRLCGDGILRRGAFRLVGDHEFSFES